MTDYKKVLIAPSILSADFSCLAADIRSVERSVDMLHIDVMDGHFVPNITIGPPVVAAISKRTALPLDVHLMIDDPAFYLDAFIEAGSAVITVHAEVLRKNHIRAIKRRLAAARVQCGISLNPGTPLAQVLDVLEFADMILVMSVNPGFGGQAFMPVALKKIERLRRRYHGPIEVDGGITDKTARDVIASGADILVAGSYIFKAPDRKKAIARLRQCAR